MRVPPAIGVSGAGTAVCNGMCKYAGIRGNVPNYHRRVGNRIYSIEREKIKDSDNKAWWFSRVDREDGLEADENYYTIVSNDRRPPEGSQEWNLLDAGREPKPIITLLEESFEVCCCTFSFIWSVKCALLTSLFTSVVVNIDCIRTCIWKTFVLPQEKETKAEAPPEIEIRMAGTEICNGTYKRNGERDGVPKYSRVCVLIDVTCNIRT